MSASEFLLGFVSSLRRISRNVRACAISARPSLLSDGSDTCPAGELHEYANGPERTLLFRVRNGTDMVANVNWPHATVVLHMSANVAG